LLFALTALLVVPSAASAQRPVQRLTVVDLNGTPARTVARMEAAVVWQAKQLRRYWQTPRVTFVRSGGWPLFLVPVHAMLTSGDAGYHGQLNSVPYAVVSSMGDALTVTFSHEIMEMLVDPLGNWVWTPGSRSILVEVCDPVDNDTFTAPNGVEVADAVTPQWYVPYSRGPWDLANILGRPGQVQGQLEFL
jgi:hypothetical protein